MSDEQTMHVEEIIYSDGSLGYRNSPLISNDKTTGGVPVEIVAVNDIELTQAEFVAHVERSRSMRADFAGDSEVRIRAKTKKETDQEWEEAQAHLERMDAQTAALRKRPRL